MLRSLAATYRTATAFARACPLLFLVPALPELAQHIVEYRIGLFASLAAARATEHDSLRLLFGSIKILVLLLPGYWVARFAWLGSPAAARSLAGVRTYLVVFVVAATVDLAAIWLPVVVGGAVGARIAVALMLATLLGTTLLAQWIARAPLGDGQPGPLRSIRTVGRVFPWALVFGLLAQLPPMALHYALNFLAVGKGPAVVVVALAADAITVCYLVAVICVVPVEITRHAEARAAR